MVTVKMLINGMFDGKMFKKGDVVEFSESALKGLDVRDYEVVETAKEAEARQKAEAKAKAKAEAEAKKAAEEAAKKTAEEAEKAKGGPDADKMQTPVATK